MRKLIYKEDHQMYYFIPVVFETNSNMSTEEMRKVSYEPRGSGRHSTSFNTFKSLMNKKGYLVTELHRLPKNEIPLNNDLEIVIGATGNY